MPDLKTDIVAWPVVAEIVDQVSIVLPERGIEVSRVVPQFGQQYVIDISEGECAETQSWVRLVSQVPSTTFPIPDAAPVFLGRTTPASPTELVSTLEVGVVHCTGWEVSNPGFIPTVEDYLTDAELCYAEMTALRIAICKALVAQKRRYSLLNYTPVNGGLVAGGFWTVAEDWMRG